MQRRELFLRMVQGEELIKPESGDSFYLGNKPCKRDEITIYVIEDLVRENLLRIVTTGTRQIASLTENCNRWFAKHGLKVQITDNLSVNQYATVTSGKKRTTSLKKEWLIEELI